MLRLRAQIPLGTPNIFKSKYIMNVLYLNKIVDKSNYVWIRIVHQKQFSSITEFTEKVNAVLTKYKLEFTGMLGDIRRFKIKQINIDDGNGQNEWVIDHDDLSKVLNSDSDSIYVKKYSELKPDIEYFIACKKLIGYDNKFNLGDLDVVDSK
jgi:hypothetical protein